MRIVFYTNPLTTDGSRRNDRDIFVQESLSRLMAAHPRHTYFLVEDGAGGPAETFGGVTRFSLQPKGILQGYRKYHHQLPALLKKLDASVVLSIAEGLALKGGVPSALVLPNGGSRDPGMERFIKAAATLATLSLQETEALVSHNLAPREAIVQVPPSALETFEPMGWEAREQVKADYSNGREYFIDLDALEEEAAVVRLLKGFSVLKKRLRSSMALVLAGEHRIPEDRITALLSNYHFRGDVLVLPCEDLSMRRRLVGAAYALVTASAGSGFRAPVLEALRSRVPVVAAADDVLRETAGEAALYFNETDFADLGDRLCDIYKFENMRALLIEKADEQARMYRWETTAEALWSAIIQASEAKK